jgi:hypothetical protein
VNAVVKEPDLRFVNAWTYHVDDRGREDRNVLVSWCGRYTVVHYPHDGVFLAFRRFPKEQRRMAQAIRASRSVEEAVDICFEHAQQEGA